MAISITNGVFSFTVLGQSYKANFFEYQDKKTGMQVSGLKHPRSNKNIVYGTNLTTLEQFSLVLEDFENTYAPLLSKAFKAQEKIVCSLINSDTGEKLDFIEASLVQDPRQDRVFEGEDNYKLPLLFQCSAINQTYSEKK